jgi:hypothetical protein
LAVPHSKFGNRFVGERLDGVELRSHLRVRMEPDCHLNGIATRLRSRQLILPQIIYVKNPLRKVPQNAGHPIDIPGAVHCRLREFEKQIDSRVVHRATSDNFDRFVAEGEIARECEREALLLKPLPPVQKDVVGIQFDLSEKFRNVRVDHQQKLTRLWILQERATNGFRKIEQLANRCLGIILAQGSNLLEHGHVPIENRFRIVF